MGSKQAFDASAGQPLNPGDKGALAANNQSNSGFDKHILSMNTPDKKVETVAKAGKDAGKDVVADNIEEMIKTQAELVKKFTESFGGVFNSISKLPDEAKQLLGPAHQEMLSRLPGGDGKQVMAHRDFLLAVNPNATEAERAKSFQDLMRNIKIG